MKINNSPYSLQLYASPAKSLPSGGRQGSRLSDFEGMTDAGSVNNAIFQKLLNDPSVQQDVKLNDDGTYSFHHDVSEGITTPHQSLAYTMIGAQNGTSGQLDAPLSTRDLEVFRQATGYNYIQAGTGYMFADDNGDPPPAYQMDMLNAAQGAFSIAKEVEKLRGQTGDLTNGDLQSMLKWQATKAGANVKMYDDLMVAIGNIESEGTNASLSA